MSLPDFCSIPFNINHLNQQISVEKWVIHPASFINFDKIMFDNLFLTCNLTKFSQTAEKNWQSFLLISKPLVSLDPESTLEKLS